MAGLQTVTTPVTGTTISSSTFGIPVANNLTVLANPPIAKMRNSTNLSIANTTSTVLTWDTEDYDSVGGHSTTANTSRYTAQAGYAGYYRCHAVTYWAGNATGRRTTALIVNGAGVAGASSDKDPGAADIVSQSVETVVYLNAGDYVEVSVWQNSGGSLSTSGTGTASAQSWFDVLWVHQ